MSRFVSIQELVKLPLLGNNDFLQRAKGRYLTWAKYVYQDMNLDVLKVAKRERFYINKRTNSIDMPCEYSSLASVSVTDKYGNMYPVWKNDKLSDDMPIVEAAKNCACEYQCGHTLCNTIKGYEAVTEVKSDFLPNGDAISFTCVSRKGVIGDTFYEENQYPQRIYLSGVWTNTVLYTETKELCKVQVDENGCICDSEENIEAVCSCCTTSEIPFGGTSETPPCENDKTWSYYCNSKMDWFSYQCGAYDGCINKLNLIYNISELGDRIIFPSNFVFDSVVIRYYSSQSIKDMYIPMVAAETFIAGLKWYDVRWNDKMQNIAIKYEQDYTKLKWGLLGQLNKYRLCELRMITTPPVNMPSYERVNYPSNNLFNSSI